MIITPKISSSTIPMIVASPLIILGICDVFYNFDLLYGGGVILIGSFIGGINLTARIIINRDKVIFTRFFFKIWEIPRSSLSMSRKNLFRNTNLPAVEFTNKTSGDKFLLPSGLFRWEDLERALS